MDFHSLTRKELQTLCKRNKIPANITNVAMADALKSLEIVEGLDEFVNRSPQKTMNKSSQDIPSTVTRTSTRRKTTKEEPQSTQPTTRTRRMTRRTMELDEENKNVNVPETPVTATSTRRRAQKNESEIEEQKKTDLLETPALLSGRRRPGVGSNRRKVEPPKEGSVQQSYGTRRSVRLLEKCMTGLSLKESEPAKIDEIVEDEVEEDKNGQSEAPAEVPLARNLSVSLEDEMDLKDDVLENSKCNHKGIDYEVISEAGSHKSDNLDAKDASLKEKTCESEAYLAEVADKQADISDGTLVPKGSDDLAVSENSNEELVVDETESIGVEEISEEFMEPIDVVSVEAAANHAPQDIECQSLVAKDCDGTIDMLNDDLPKLPEAEENQGGLSQNVSVLPHGHMDSSEKMGNEESENAPDHIVMESTISNAFLGDSDIDDDDTGSDNNSLADELQEEVSCEQKSSSIPTVCYSSKDPVINMVNEEGLVEVNVAQAEKTHVAESSFHNAPRSVVDYISIDKMLDDVEALVDVNVADELQEEVSCEQKSNSIPTASYSPEDPMINLVNEEALVDVNVAEAQSSSHNAPQSVVDYIPTDEMLDDAEALVDVNVADELQEEVSCDQKSISIPTASYSPEDPMINMVNEEALVDVKVAEAAITLVVESSSHNAPQSVVNYIPIDDMLDDAEAFVDVCVNPAEEFEEVTREILPEKTSPIAANEEALVDVKVAEAEITLPVESSSHNAPQSVVNYIPIDDMLDDAEAFVDACVNPAEEFEEVTREILPEKMSRIAAKLTSPCPSIVSNSVVTTSMPLSPLAAQVSQPTGFTPRKCSSMKKQTTIPKVIQVSDNNNKENIDNNSANEVETNIGKVKKSKNIIDKETMQKLEGMSLRSLQKLTKKFDKLDITDNMKNKEDKNDNIKALGKTRAALQTLPQNCMSTGEAEKQN